MSATAWFILWGVVVWALAAGAFLVFWYYLRRDQPRDSEDDG